MALSRPRGPISSRPRELVGVVGRVRVTWWYRGHRRPAGPPGYELWNGKEWIPFYPYCEVDNMGFVFSGAPGAGLPPVPRDAGKALAKWPRLCSLLAEREYDDKKPIGVVQLQIRTAGDRFEGNLKMADHGGLTMKGHGRTVDELLTLLEAGLSSSPQAWEPDPYPLNGSKAKKK